MSFSFPSIGFGTYQLRGEAGTRAVRDALSMGYRLIDSAYNYENEGAVGKAVRTSEVPREEIILTSKLPGRYHGREEARVAVEESLARTGLDYLDLYLIHWPNPKQGRYVEAWEALIEAKERGLVREIGVSNFLPEHIGALEAATGVTPVVNQLERHPSFNQSDVVAYHREHGVALEAWSPLGRTAALDNPTIVSLAEERDITPGELVLSWQATTGWIALPKASSQERQRQNLTAAQHQLDDAAVAAINALSRPDGRRKDQDPAEYEEF